MHDCKQSSTSPRWQVRLQVPTTAKQPLLQPNTPSLQACSSSAGALLQVAASQDGSSVVVGVENASLGLLTPQSREYATLGAAHRGAVIAVSTHVQL